MTLHWQGLVIGAATFLIIGLFHPLVVKTEYYTGTRLWWLFLVGGIALLIIDMLWVRNTVLNAVIGAFAFSSFWSIGELFQQRGRVRKGWFPKNPKRQYD